MIFSSFTFLVFFFVVLLVQWYVIGSLIPERRRLKSLHVFLLVASYFFYMSWDWRFGFLIAFSTLLDYSAGLFMQRMDESAHPRRDAYRRFALVVSMVVNLGILGFYKYTDFFINSFVDLIHFIQPETIGNDLHNSLLLRLILPLGISFFTFQSMSYTIDVYRRVIPVEKSLVRFALFVSFFPQLVAGPIVTAKEFLPQLEQMPRFDLARMRLAARWFLMGFIKKSVIADNIAPIVDAIYSDPSAYGTAGHWLGAWGFWVQVYGDFSGYSDMAIGTALFLGYHLPENFRLPYLSTSISEHWRRWHISLLRWIRDYLYIPLGGNRVSFLRHKLNLFLTMFLAGFWHGANWTFVIWGSIHGLFLVLESSSSAVRSKARSGESENNTPRILPLPIRTAILTAGGFFYTTIITVAFGTMFRAQTIQDSWLILQRMAGFNTIPEAPLSPDLIRPVLYAVFAIYSAHIAGKFLFDWKKIRIQIPATLEVALYPVALLILTQIAATDTEAFIYFVF